VNKLCDAPSWLCGQTENFVVKTIARHVETKARLTVFHDVNIILVLNIFMHILFIAKSSEFSRGLDK